MTNIRAVIFDCDGTLIDNEEMHLSAWRKTMQKRGCDLTLEQSRSFTGKSSPDIAKLVAKVVGSDSSEEILAEKRAYYYELNKEGSPPVQGTVDFLKRLAQDKRRLGLKLAVASAAIKPDILENLKHLGIEKMFDVILSGQDDLHGYSDPEGINKPKPYIYLHTAKLLNVPPSECVAVEDSMTGVQSAKAAGCITVAIPNRFTGMQDLSAADFKMKTLSNISVDEFLHLAKQTQK